MQPGGEGVTCLASQRANRGLLLLCVKFTFLSNSTRVVHVTMTFIVSLHKSNLIAPGSSCSHIVTVIHLFLHCLIHAITYFPPTETAKQPRDIYQAAVRYRPAHCNRAANITQYFYILTLFRIFPKCFCSCDVTSEVCTATGTGGTVQ